MNAWTLAIENLKNLPPPPEPEQVSLTGRCLYCGDPLPIRRKKYCTDQHMRTHRNIIANAARYGKKP